MKNKCSFCGSIESKDRTMIKGFDNVFICESCIKICQKEVLKEKNTFLFKNKEALEKVDKSNVWKEFNVDNTDKDLYEDNLISNTKNSFESINKSNKEDLTTSKNEDRNEKTSNSLLKDKSDGYSFEETLKILDLEDKDLLKYKDNNFFNNHYSFEKPKEFTEEETITSKKDKATTPTFKDYTPSKLKKELDKFVIGQEEAKKILSVAVYNHYKRTQVKNNINKGNILMIGPTGSGKTYILQQLARIINVPLLIVDATSFTEAGYVGRDVEDILEDLIDKANGDIALAEKGIVYIDEIDKIASKEKDTHSTLDIGGVGVQQSLLKIIEGDEVSIGYKGMVERKINTKDILFVCGGAFFGLEKESDLKNNPIGFNKTIKNTIKGNEKSIYSTNINQQDIIEYGFLPEFVGRLPVIVQLNELDKNDLCDILTKTEDSILNEYKELLKMDNKELIFEKEAIELIAQNAINKNIGARGLRGAIEKKMYEIMFSAPDSDTKKIVITKDLFEED